MKKIIVTILLLYPQNSNAQSIVGGIVVADHYSRITYDRIVIETRLGYTNAEVYGGYGATVEGWIIFGELHSFGFTDIYDEYGDEVGRLYIDDYMAGKSSAIDWCFEE